MIRWEQSEFIFCDLQAAARFVREYNPHAAERFLHAAYDTFDFLVQNPHAGRTRADLGFPEVRSWRVKGFPNYLIFYRQLPERIQIWRVLHAARDLHRQLSGR